MNKKAVVARLLTAVLPLLVLLVVAEVGLRVYYLTKRANRPQLSELSELEGWIGTPDVESEFEARAYGRILYSTNSEGFRVWGDPATEKTKILFIGDSYTQAYQVSDGLAYYDVVGKSREDTEVFAYGVGGYGSLQELMVLERWLRTIRPDLVVWQAHTNDIVNNDFRLESSSSENNNHMRRPYYEDGAAVLRHPDGRALGFLAEISYVFRRLAVIRDSLTKRVVGSGEEQMGLADDGFRRSLATTKAILARAAEAADPAPLILFVVQSGAAPLPYEAVFTEELCGDRRWHCIRGLDERIRAVGQADIRVDGGSDDHWNDTGHRMAGLAIVDFLETQGFLGVRSKG